MNAPNPLSSFSQPPLCSCTVLAVKGMLVAPMICCFHLSQEAEVLHDPLLLQPSLSPHPFPNLCTSTAPFLQKKIAVANGFLFLFCITHHAVLPAPPQSTSHPRSVTAVKIKDLITSAFFFFFWYGSTQSLLALCLGIASSEAQKTLWSTKDQK